MEDEKQRIFNESKDREKAALVKALSELPAYIRHYLSDQHTEAVIIRGVVLAPPSSIVALPPVLRVIPKLHQEGTLGQYIGELKLTDPKLQSIIDEISKITPAQPPEPSTVVVRSSSPPATQAPRGLGMFRPSESGRKTLDPRVSNALMGVFFGGILTATASMIVAAQAMGVGGLATSGFPPVAGILFVIGGGLLLTSLAFMAYYGYQNHKSMSETFAHVKLASSRA